MKRSKFTSRELSILSALAAISAVTQLIHVGYQSPTWGMWIDVVAITWIVAFFLFGVRASLIVSILGGLIITLFAPDTWLGASMKWVATLPMWGSLFIFMLLKKLKLSDYRKPVNIILPTIFGILIRCLIVIPLNYYYAIPIWTGMSPQQAISAIPWYVIAAFNAIQGVFDIVLAWIIVFRFRIDRYANWNT